MEPTTDRKRYLRAAALPVALVLATAGGLGVWANRAMHPEGIGSGLRIAEDAVDFGKAWEQRDFVWRVPIKNTSRKVIEIIEMRGSCACASVQPKSMTLAPGEVDQFVLHLDLRAKTPQEGPSTAQPFSVKLVPVIKGAPPGTPAWTIRGEVQSAFRLSCDTLDFGDCLTVGSAYPVKCFQVRCLIPQTGLQARCDESLGTVLVLPVEAEEWDYQVDVSPNARLPIGEHKFPVQLRTIPPNDGERPPGLPAEAETSVEVVARVYRQIRAFPEHLLLGGGEVGEILKDTVALGSADVPFTVTRIECDPSESLSVEELRSDSEEPASRVTRRYVVTQKVTAAGIQHGEVRFFVVGDEVDPDVPVVMRFSYQGFDAPGEM